MMEFESGMLSNKRRNQLEDISNAMHEALGHCMLALSELEEIDEDDEVFPESAYGSIEDAQESLSKLMEDVDAMLARDDAAEQEAMKRDSYYW